MLTLAEKHNKTPEQIALRWSIQRDVIPIPKSSHKDRIAENADVFDFFLADDDMNLLNNLDANPKNKNRLRDNMPGTVERKNKGHRR
ncbi:aldo/keto reductase [Carnobacterium mobile]|uniref:aldo/keto reductase n=1 Tax=Carnobacterium mobile TaxID=2750 RepID=UPI000A6397CA|nr:aldo/keto reductase [Carnobacterium mobile]